MGPKQQQRKADRTPTKVSSKKQKLSGPESDRVDMDANDSETEVRGHAMAAPMASKLRRYSNEESSGEDESPRWFSLFEMRLDQRLNKLDEVAEKIDGLTLKVEEHDQKIEGLQFDLNTVNERMKTLKTENEQMLLKLDDLENRGRRINLIFYNVPEQPNTHENCLDTVTDIINNFVGFDQPCSTFVERCHRTGQKGNKPRIIHVAFASFATREKVRKACIAKFKQSSYKGTRISVGEDFSKRIVQLRKEKMPRFRALKEQGKQPFFVYPAFLKYRVDGTLFSAE